ncbi:MAG: hypothetical protein WBD40_12535 [Tepidisphaeraceae bacterium]
MLRFRMMTAAGFHLAAIALLFAAGATSLRAADAVLANDRYAAKLSADQTVTLSTTDAASAVFRPTFSVQFTKVDPKVALRPADLAPVKYSVTTWKTSAKTTGDGIGTVNTDVSAGDGFDDSILKGDKEGRVTNLYAAAPVETVTASSAKVEGGEVRFAFPQNRSFALAATLAVPKGTAAPVLSFRFTPKADGYWSVGYTGAAEIAIEDADEIWQPLVWTEKRFPDRSYLTAAFHGPLPGTMVTSKGVTTALIADPKELPFQPLPTFDNSRFGMSVRSAAGKAQPAIFAPMLGGPGSQMKAGKPLEFAMRLIVQQGGCVDTLERTARELYGFRDIRQNNDVSLNATLVNMIAYGLSEYSRFNEDLRGCAYDTDAPGTVKNVSALHPLAVALVTDDAEIYRRRARPIIEFMMSREKFLFATDPQIKIQNPSWLLNGPCAPLSELAALHAMSQGRNPIFLTHAAKMLGLDRTLNLDVQEKGRSWQNLLAMYRATGAANFLDEAKREADKYLARRIDKTQMDFKDPESKGMFFWSSHAPQWIDLLELYGETQDKKYLDAAREGARSFTQYTWFAPAIPDQSVTVNQGGVAPEYWYIKSRGLGPIKLPEETLPAWRVSEWGLTCESSGTSAGHRAVLLANHAPWMLRLAQLTGDQLLHDVARNAVVGRYANFPGYHINTARTTVYEKVDYPLREYKALTYNSFHFNHIWPHIALVVDYLVSDAYTKSDGAIDFPSRYAEGYAYIRSKVYGDRPGSFYGDKDVWLWMPKDLVSIDSPQINHVSARGNGKLYLALLNQSPAEVNAAVKLDTAMLGIAGGTLQARVWRDNKPAPPADVSGRRFVVPVSAGGITAIAIEGVNAKPRFQGDLFAGKPLSDKSYATLKTGDAHAMLLSMGGGMTHAYVYLKQTFKDLKSAKLSFKDGNDWKTVEDAKYPYEFTVERPDDDKPDLEFFVEVVKLDGTTEKSETAVLAR